MAQHQAQNPTKGANPFGLLSHKDRDLLRLHMAFDEISEILRNKCFATEQNRIANDLLKSSRHFIIKTFLTDFAEGGKNGK